MFDLDEEIERGIGGEWIANVVCVEDNVVVIIESGTYEQFSLLLVDKMVHVVQKSFEVEWGSLVKNSPFLTKMFSIAYRLLRCNWGF